MAKRPVQQTLKQAQALCRKRGVRLTEQRSTVLRLLCEADKPLSAYDLLDRLRESLPNPAPPTVYRALEFLQAQGLVHKLESLHAYIGCSHPDHPHTSQFLICSDCGEVAEVADPQIDLSLRRAGKAAGFLTEKPVVELLGTCAQCADKHH